MLYVVNVARGQRKGKEDKLFSPGTLLRSPRGGEATTPSVPALSTNFTIDLTPYIFRSSLVWYGTCCVHIMSVCISCLTVYIIVKSCTTNNLLIVRTIQLTIYLPVQEDQCHE